MKIGAFLLGIVIFSGESKAMEAQPSSERVYTQAEVLELLQEVDAARQIIALQQNYITALESQINQRDQMFANIAEELAEAEHQIEEGLDLLQHSLPDQNHELF